MDSEPVQDECWLDITSDFQNAVHSLNLGELCKSDQLTLLTAMAAIELMDSKMDGGTILSNTDREILNLEQSVRQGKVKIKDLELRELIDIIDDTYACLVTWLDGQWSLAQTVMINLYLHDTERIEDKCLRVFSRSILKIVDYFDKLVQLTYCIEEEDFAPNNGRFDLASQFSEHKLLNSLNSLCLEYESFITGCRMASGKQTVTEPKTSELKLLPELISKLRFTYYLYACLFHLSKNVIKEYNIAGPNQSIAIKKLIKTVEGTAKQCYDHLGNCLLQFADFKKLHIFFTDAKGSRHEGYPTTMGFEPLINYKQLPPAFPKGANIYPRQQTWLLLLKLADKLRRCIKISESFYQKSIDESLNSIEQFSRYDPESCVISRAFLQALYLPNRVAPMMEEEIQRSMVALCEPLMRSIKQQTDQADLFDEYMSECVKTFSQAVLLYGHNRARQHERLSDLIISFKNLQTTAYMICDLFANSFQNLWTTFHFAKICSKFVTAGIELELYSVHEYNYVYWYLSRILYANQEDQIALAKGLILNSSRPNKGTKNKKLKNPIVKTKLHDDLILENRVLRQLTEGLYLTTFGMELQGLIRKPSRELSSKEVCFNHRFGSIKNAYDAYLRDYNKLVEEYDFNIAYPAAGMRFGEAVELINNSKNLEAYRELAEDNLIRLDYLSRGQELSGVKFSFEKHSFIPTLVFLK